MGDPWRAHRTQLRDALGLTAEVTEELVSILELALTDGRLYVNDECENMHDFISRLHTVIMSVWKFTKFTESRWLTVGARARSFVCGFFLGRSDLVGEISSNPQNSLFYLNGFKRMGADRRHGMVQAALVSWIPEPALAERLEDARAALVYNELWQALAKHMTWLVTLPSYIWETLAAVTEVERSVLQSGCIDGAHKAFLDFWRRVLQPASQLPWRLCQGYNQENIDELQEEAQPDDPVSKSIWELRHMEAVPSAHIVAGVRLLGECPWCTLQCEHRHRSLAVFRRWHPDIGLVPLLSRAFMLQHYRIALPSCSKGEKELSKDSIAITQLRNHTYNSTRGTQSLVKDMFEHLREQPALDGSVELLDQGLRQLACSRMRSVWAALPLHERHELLMRARRVMAVQKIQATDDMRKMENKHKDLLQNVTAETGVKPCLKMSAAALTVDASTDLKSKLWTASVPRGLGHLRAVPELSSVPCH